MLSCGFPFSSAAQESSVPARAEPTLQLDNEAVGAIPYSADLKQRLQTAWENRPAGYKPRTRHLREDNTPKYTNRLFLESSPYLLQHAHNPVNWYPWGDEAFETAAQARPAGAVERRLLDLSLVPRDGGGVVRRSPRSRAT